MTAVNDFDAVPAFEVRASAEQRVPFVFSSPHSGRHYPDRFLGESGMRPDFIVGDRFGVSAASGLSACAIALLTAMGYAVGHNKPYAGGFITEHYGRPARGLHALQIEVNRGLYMNERTLEKTAGFEALAEDLRRFCAELMALSDSVLLPMPLAAE